MGWAHCMGSRSFHACPSSSSSAAARRPGGWGGRLLLSKSNEYSTMAPRKSITTKCNRSCAWHVAHVDMLMNSKRGPLLHHRGRLRSSHSLRLDVHTSAFDPSGGGDSGNGGNGPGRGIINLAIAGLLAYLLLSGSLNWLFDAILSLWILLSLVSWIAERNLIRGLCPNCGGEFQVFEFSMKNEPRFCPYCSQPFKLENKQFIREDPHFSNEQRSFFNEPFQGFDAWDTLYEGELDRSFRGFGNKRRSSKYSSREQKGSDVIVDVEAEIRDKD